MVWSTNVFTSCTDTSDEVAEHIDFAMLSTLASLAPSSVATSELAEQVGSVATVRALLVMEQVPSDRDVSSPDAKVVEVVGSSLRLNDDVCEQSGGA